MKKYRKLAMVLLSVMIVAMLSACGTSEKESEMEKEDEVVREEVDDGIEIVMPHDNYYYTGQERPVDMIVDELEELGFTNITTIEDEPGMFYFSVESVEIFTDSSDKNGSFDEREVFSSNDLVEIHYYGGPMEDGMIQGTNAQDIENELKSVEEYNWWDDHNLIQSEINGEWSVLCKNNEYDTYTKSYELSAYDYLQIEIAKFITYDADYNYLQFCASLFDTDLIDAEEVKKWIEEYNPSEGYITKNFGDAEFVLDGDGEGTIELSIWALE